MPDAAPQQAKPAMWTAVLQPEENESDLERFADAPEADPDQTGLPTDATTPTAQDADGHEPQGMDPAAPADSGQRQPAAAGGKPAEEPWPAEGAYDMSKRCVNAVLPATLSSRSQAHTEGGCCVVPVLTCWSCSVLFWQPYLPTMRMLMYPAWCHIAFARPDWRCSHAATGMFPRDIFQFCLVASALGRCAQCHSC